MPGTRYQVVGPIGRGGMGIVLRVIDTDLRRPLAVKVILDREGGRQHEERFLEEARITGQLQHPGIPPVHEIGRLADGRPFFAMKLIEGHTLAELLQQRPSPQADLAQFLKIFEQVSQTLAYAHSQGVMHRDLKPANIMVGAFGEVQVMDWGLAKRLRGEVAPGGTSQAAPISPPGLLPAEDDKTPLGWPATIAATSPPRPTLPQAEVSTEIPSPMEETCAATPPVAQGDASDRLTQAGSVLGTPAYMPPEQARGEIAALDERSDVFGLGAMLCETLTGRPPYVGANRLEVLGQAERGDLTDAWQRLETCGADEELIELAKECLAGDRPLRLPSAGELARRLGSYFASVQERLQQARVERAELEAREERRRRRRAVVLAAAVVLLVLGAGAMGLWSMRLESSARRNYLEQEVAAALDDADRLRQVLGETLQEPRTAAELMSDLDRWQSMLDSAQAAWKRADALAAGDRGLLSPGLTSRLTALAEALGSDERDRQLAFELDSIRLGASNETAGRMRLRNAAPKLAAAFGRAGYDFQQQSPQDLAARIAGSPIRWPLVAAVDYWAAVVGDSSQAERLFEVVRGADPHPWRDRFRRLEVVTNLDRLRVVGATWIPRRSRPK